jgi:hypothetical protein
MTIYCPGCGKRLEPEKGALERHEMRDMTQDSGYLVAVDIICFEQPDRVFSISADEN